VAEPLIADIYVASRDRIDALVRPLDEGTLATPVAACPGWSVRDLVGHLAALPRWAAEGRLQGLPTDDDTAQQVAEVADVPLPELLDQWAEAAPGFAELAASLGLWPAAIDVVTHEHDLRHAIGRPDARDDEAVRTLADLALAWWRPSRPVEVVRVDRVQRVGPADGEPLRWRTDDFELLRARMGRRSRAQLAAMDWSSDPGPLLDELTVFPPAAVDIDG